MAKREPAVPEMGERLWLAALGKHPGWNDHLDDIGLDMDRLVAVKRHLYVDGIGGVIGAGTWEAMDGSAHDEGFSHSFLWRQPDGLVVGRMWSSSDGKGRRKYPMIVCALCRSLPLAFVGGPVLDRLRQLEGQCKASETAAGVISAVDRMRGELRDLASYTPAVTGDPFEGEPAATRLADAEEMGPDGQGLLRVLYQMEREMAAYLRPEGTMTGSRSRTLEVRAQHMRVPAAFEPECMSWSVWTRLLLARVDQLAPLLLISKDGKGWLDVIVGEPGVTQLACLQGSAETYPLTTDIPFTIDEETERFGRKMIERARAGEISELDPGYIDVPADRLAPFMKKARRPQSEGKDKSRKQLIWAVAAAVFVLLVCVVLAIIFLGGSGGEQASSDAEHSSVATATAEPGEPGEPPAESVQVGSIPSGEAKRPGPDHAPDTATDRVGRFQIWCQLADEWYLPFTAGLDLDAAVLEPVLRGGLVKILGDAKRSGLKLDPMEVGPGRYRSLAAMGDNPPAKIGDAKYEPAIAGALAHIESVRSAIDPEHWPAHGAVVVVLDQLDKTGEVANASLRAIRDDLTSQRGELAARGVISLVPIGPEIGRLASALSMRSTYAEVLRGVGASEQAGWYGGLEVTPENAEDDLDAWLAKTVARSEELAAFGDQLADSARRDLPRIDPGLLREAMAGVEGVSPETDLRSWLAALQDKSLYLLDSSTDPRRVLVDGDWLVEVDARLGSLLGEGDSGEAAEQARLVSAWRDEMTAMAGLSWNEANKSGIERGADGLLTRRRNILERVDAIERERHLEAATYVTDLRGRAVVSTTGSAAIDGVWVSVRDELLSSFERDENLVKLSRAVDGVVAELQAIEASMPQVVVDLSRLGPAGEKVGRLLSGSRDEYLGDAAARRGDAGQTERAAEDYARWASGVTESAGLLGAMINALDFWAAMDEQTGSSGTLRDSLGRWGETWLGQRLALGEIDPRLDLVAEQIAPGARSSLIKIIGDETLPAGVVYAAWQALGKLKVWPANRGDLAADAAAIARLRAEKNGLPAPRRTQIEQALSDGARVRWARTASSAEDWSGFRPLVPIASMMGLADSSLPAVYGFDMTVARLMDRIEGGATLDRDQILSEMEHWLRPGSGIEGHAEAIGWLGSLRDTLAGRAEDDVDYRTIGPARVGWVVEPYESGRRLVYTWLRENEPAVRMGFRLVESSATGAFYLSDTEVPASLLIDFVLPGPHGELVLGVMDQDWTPSDDPRPGPLVWTWRRQRGGGRGVQLSRTWTSRSQGDEGSYYASALADRVGRPSGSVPLQRVSPRAAAVLAALTGCRLPKSTEWAAAYESVNTPPVSDEWNLRDQSFDTQRAFVATFSDARAIRWPDEGVFLPDGVDDNRGADAASHGWSDGRLWFDEVGSGRDRPFRHLVGNVAEYVLSTNAVEAMLTDRAGKPSGLAGGVVSAESASFAVIGGSALSPPGLPVMRAIPLGGRVARSGFSDVGFRLAFSPGIETPLIVQVGEHVRTAPYLRGVE